MSNYVEFKGLKHYPIGNAQLQVENDKLTVSGMSECSDGVMVSTSGTKISKIVSRFQNLQVDQNKRLSITFNGLDGKNRYKTLEQAITYFDQDKGEIAYGWNSRLLPDTFTLVGEKDGNEKFRKQYNKQDFPYTNILPLLYFVNKAMNCYSYHSDTDKNGNTTTSTDWDCGESIVKPVDDGGSEYNVDRFYLEVVREHPDDTPSYVYAGLNNIQVQGCGFQELVITDYKFS